jgi:hypothetical protein
VNEATLNRTEDGGIVVGDAGEKLGGIGKGHERKLRVTSYESRLEHASFNS